MTASAENRSCVCTTIEPFCQRTGITVRARPRSACHRRVAHRRCAGVTFLTRPRSARYGVTSARTVRIPARGEGLTEWTQPGEVAVLADDLAQSEQVELAADLGRGADHRERDPAIPEAAGHVDDGPAAGEVDIVHRVGEEGEPTRWAGGVRERTHLVGEARGVREEQPHREAIDDQPRL